MEVVCPDLTSNHRMAWSLLCVRVEPSLMPVVCNIKVHCDALLLFMAQEHNLPYLIINGKSLF